MAQKLSKQGKWVFFAGVILSIVTIIGVWLYLKAPPRYNYRSIIEACSRGNTAAYHQLADGCAYEARKRQSGTRITCDWLRANRVQEACVMAGAVGLKKAEQQYGPLDKDQP